MGKDKSETPLVTVITPTYNRALFLPETIESVLSQNYQNIEYIVIDDGSTDNTQDVLKKYSDKIRFLSHANIGENQTVNKGFELSRGDIILVVNSDDPLLPGAISEAVKTFNSNEEVLVVYSDWIEIDEESNSIREIKLPDYTIDNMLLSFCVEMGPGTFFRRDVFEFAGYRDIYRKYTGDLEFWFRLSLYGPFFHLPKALATHRTHKGAASVAHKGIEMANEIISLGVSILNHPKLPVRLLKRKHYILSLVNFTATSYCGEDREKARYFYFQALKCDPLRTPIRFLKKLILFVYNFYASQGKGAPP